MVKELSIDVDIDTLQNTINFICPICEKSVESDMYNVQEDEEINVIIDPDNWQAYHTTCLEKEKVYEN